MTKRIFIPGMIVGALLLTGIYSQAMTESDLASCRQGDGPELTLGEGHHGQRQERKMERMTVILDLSADQQEQIKQLFSAERDRQPGARQQIRTTRKALNDLMHARPFDETAFRALAVQQAEQRIEMMVAHAKTKQQVFALLTPQQQVKADELWSLMGKRHRDRGMKR